MWKLKGRVHVTHLFMFFQGLMMFLMIFGIILCFSIYVNWRMKMLFSLINLVSKLLLMLLECLKGVCVFGFDKV